VEHRRQRNKVEIYSFIRTCTSLRCRLQAGTVASTRCRSGAGDAKVGDREAGRGWAKRRWAGDEKGATRRRATEEKAADREENSGDGKEEARDGVVSCWAETTAHT
jgi:hypothetical protein